MQEENRKEFEPMASEIVRVAREAEARAIHLMVLEAIKQGKNLEEFEELLKARIQSK